ncbi:21192_t:CDS:2, partial [Rhizophagus irregularis]
DNLDEAGMANVEQGFRMIIDTGATTTVIPDFVRKKLNAQDGWNASRDWVICDGTKVWLG